MTIHTSIHGAKKVSISGVTFFPANQDRGAFYSQGLIITAEDGVTTVITLLSHDAPVVFEGVSELGTPEKRALVSAVSKH